jgi:hypothetical protein
VDKVVHAMAAVGAHVVSTLVVRYAGLGVMMLSPVATSSTRCINLMIIAPKIRQPIRAKRSLTGSLTPGQLTISLTTRIGYKFRTAIIARIKFNLPMVQVCLFLMLVTSL